MNHGLTEKNLNTSTDFLTISITMYRVTLSAVSKIMHPSKIYITYKSKI